MSPLFIHLFSWQTSSDMNKKTKDANPTKTSPKYSTTPTGCRDLCTCALSPWEILQAAGESPDLKFLGIAYDLEHQRWVLSHETAAMRALHGQLRVTPGTQFCLVFRAAHDLALAFQPSALHAPYSTLFHWPTRTSCCSSPVLVSTPLHTFALPHLSDFMHILSPHVKCRNVYEGFSHSLPN